MELRTGKKRRHGELAFTLMEVTLAILILAGSLTTLVGLQSAIVRRTGRDKQSQLAMLAARRILAGIELADETDTNEEEGTADELVAKIGRAEMTDEERAALKGLSASLKVEDQSLPNLEDLSFRRATLEVSWGLEATDRIVVYYILPGKAQ